MENYEKKYNIVLDLDETLIHAYDDLSDDQIKLFNNLKKSPKYKNRLFTINIPHPSHPIGSGNKFTLYVIKRPYLDEFIEFCFNNFITVNIWSAGTHLYVSEIVKQLFKYKKPNHVYTANNINFNIKPYSKPLLSLVNNDTKHLIRMDNTYIIDDRPDNFIPNKDNGIKIDAYAPKFNKKLLDNDIDTSLLEVMKEFTKLFNYTENNPINNINDVHNMNNSLKI